MADDGTVATLLDQLVALDPAARRDVAAMLRSLAGLAEEYRDGRSIAHTCGVLADLLDPPERAAD